jgi:flagellar hook assembly protein FlgD
LNNGSNQLNITNLAQNSKNVKIYSLNGALVRNIPLDDPTRGGFGAQAIWPGDNDCGELVASGIYLIFAYTEDGKTHVAKVAVIRE